jgi:hypothetical protein
VWKFLKKARRRVAIGYPLLEIGAQATSIDLGSPARAHGSMAREEWPRECKN